MDQLKKLYVGIDPSLSHTGLFFLYEDGKYDGIQIDTSLSQFRNSIARCQFIVQTILDLIQQKVKCGYEVAMITCQDYFTGRQPGTVIQLAQLGTMIRYLLLKKDLPLCVTAPTKLKKFVTEKGNAPKNVMLKSVFKKWGYDLTTDNIADASGLANFAKIVYMLQNNEQVKLKNFQKQVFKGYQTKDCLLKLKN